MATISDQECVAMARVVTEISVQNIGDVLAAFQGTLPADRVRSATIADALVDTGSTFLSLPASVIRQLGLLKISTKRVTTSKGPSESTLYAAVRLTIQGRFCTTDVLEVPDGVPALIGQIPLENLDFIVDPRNQKLIGNPRHGGEQMFEQF